MRLFTPANLPFLHNIQNFVIVSNSLTINLVTLRLNPMPLKGETKRRASHAVIACNVRCDQQQVISHI